MTSRGQCPRGGGVRLVFHPSKFRPPPPPGWLATGLHACTATYIYNVYFIRCSRVVPGYHLRSFIIKRGPSPFGPRCRLFNIGPKAGAPCACRPNKLGPSISNIRPWNIALFVHYCYSLYPPLLGWALSATRAFRAGRQFLVSFAIMAGRVSFSRGSSIQL